MIIAQPAVTAEAVPVAILPALPQPGTIDEANHRIANNLQLLTALLSLEARRVADPAATAILDRMMRRIGAIAGVHRQLYRARAAATVDLGAYLADLGAGLDEIGADVDAGRRIFVEPAPVEVSAEEATAIGIIVSELVGNACKYAYAPGTPGQVRIALRALPLGGYWLEVSDYGSGRIHGQKAQGSGLGSQLIAMMAERLDATHAWHDNAPGTRFTLCAPRSR